jgi:hypothetical protein
VGSGLPFIRWFSREDTFRVPPLITDRTGSPNRVSWNRGIIIRGEIRKRNWELNYVLALFNALGALREIINLRKILHLDNYSRFLEDVIAEISDSFDS